jgi:hypothetical protein
MKSKQHNNTKSSSLLLLLQRLQRLLWNIILPLTLILSSIYMGYFSATSEKSPLVKFLQISRIVPYSDYPDILVFHAPDPILKSVQVWNRYDPSTGIARILEFGETHEVIHSSMYVSDPFGIEEDYQGVAATSLVLLEEEARIKPKIASIGLGGGSLIKYLYKIFKTKAEFHAVDISYNVYRVARDLFQFYNLSHVKTFIMDGRDFFHHQPNNYYDWIFLDAFDQHEGPVDFLFDKNFATSVYNALQPGGVCAINVYEMTGGPNSNLNAYLKLFGMQRSGMLEVSEEQQVAIFIKRPGLLTQRIFVDHYKKHGKKIINSINLLPYVQTFEPLKKTKLKKIV